MTAVSVFHVRQKLRLQSPPPPTEGHVEWPELWICKISDTDSHLPSFLVKDFTYFRY